jgi:AcrR family transcriptional regulator
MFCDNGYSATTMEAVGKASGVAVQTVYYVFRTKAQLLQLVIQFAAAGQHEPLPVDRRPWTSAMLETTSGARALALAVEHGTEIYARMAPLLDTVRTAASVDEDVAAYWEGVATGRRRGMAELAARLDSLVALRPGLNVNRAADIIFVVDSHETFLGFTRTCGWSIVEYKAWLYRTLCRELLAEQPDRLTDDSPSPTSDLSYHDLLSEGRPLQ